MIMWSKRNFAVLCIAAFAFLISGCNGGELSESESFFNFIRAVDPKNVLKIEWNRLMPHLCSHRLKGVKCNSQATNIIDIRLENMNFSGIIDTDSLCKLPKLRVLSLAKNQIRGSISDSILNCTSLKYLNLSSNLLTGSVPRALTRMKNLRRLDISNNPFYGIVQYPSIEFKLRNNFITVRVLKQMDGLAPEPERPQSSDLREEHKKVYEKWTTWLPLIVGIVFFCVLIFYVNMKIVKSAKDKEILKSLAQSPPKTPPPTTREIIEEVKPEERKLDLVFFVEEKERFKLEDLLEAAADLQSQGLWSSLYKVQLKNNAIFAVKRLKKLQVSLEEFGQTMRKIGNLKHANILPLVGFNSSVEEKLLIYRYQRNGSLLTLLENYTEGKRDFPWKLRLSIAAGIARGLDFIYQQRSDDGETIPHGNIKLSNILLNENEEPLISEYGYSKFVDPKIGYLLNSNGYIAPEKSVSEQADVFSFGVILLELLTGKLVEKSGLDLPKWVKSMVREEWTGEVFDKKIAMFGMYAFPLLNISLKCVAHFPENRPSIYEVLEKIEEVVYAQEDLSPSSVSSMEFNQHDSSSVLLSVAEETLDTPGSNY